MSDSPEPPPSPANRDELTQQLRELLQEIKGLRADLRPQRRDPSRQVAAGWLWLLVLILLVGVVYFTMGFGDKGYSAIGGSDFRKLIEEHQIGRVVFVGTDRVEGELKEGALQDVGKLSPELKQVKSQIRHSRVWTFINPNEIRSKQEVTELCDRAKVPYSFEPERSDWVGPLLMLGVPVLILLALFLLFLLPRLLQSPGRH
jgi:hypothetical protein